VILLDTHAWLWHVAAPDRLSATARAAIDRADRVGVATISCWEVVMLELRGRIALDRPVERWIRHALAQERTEPVPLTVEIAVRAALLESEGFPGDPADRIIYASSRAEGAKLVTRDEPLRHHDASGTVW
jgi:PIN domain nuclease of toxin-antitoxin system